MTRNPKPLWIALAALTAVATAGTAAEPPLIPTLPLPIAPDHPGDHLYTGPGPMVFPAGHIQPIQGRAVLHVEDLVFDPVGGMICQAPSGEACTPGHPLLENAVVFCNGITLIVGTNWDPGLDLWVYLGSPFDTAGYAFGVTCEDPRPATTGYVTHFP